MLSPSTTTTRKAIDTTATHRQPWDLRRGTTKLVKPVRGAHTHTHTHKRFHVHICLRNNAANLSARSSPVRSIPKCKDSDEEVRLSIRER